MYFVYLRNYLMNIIVWLKEVGLTGLMDIALMWLLIYTILVWLKRTRVAFVLTGMGMVAGIYLLARQFDLTMTVAVFEKFFAVILIALVVIFQEELRYIFERMAMWSLNRRITRRKTVKPIRAEVDAVVRTVMELARERIGALIVFRGRDMIIRHLEGGVNLNGELSEPLLMSIFDPHSVGHDGAVIVEVNRITQFGSYLPLSKNLKKIKGHGTRHAAALGLAELTDALCLVVSEERGTISVARNSEMEEVADPERLTLILENLFQEMDPKRQVRPWQDYFKKNSREKLMALLSSLVLWFVLVHGSAATYSTFTVPAAYAELPKAWKVTQIDPKDVTVTFRGPRSAFYFFTRERVKLYLKLKLKDGAQNVRLFSSDLTFPKDMVVEYIEPKSVSVIMEKTSSEN